MKVIQVFEHQILKIGTAQHGGTFEQRHFKRFRAEPKSKFFNIVHEGIQFKQYVGAIQCDDLTIEILPKADKHHSSPTLWRNFLLDMLRYCKWLKLDTTQLARLSTNRSGILALYYEIFLDELKKILNKGLYRSYRTTSGNQKAIRGNIQFEQHLAKNYIHQERFFTSYTKYDFNHPLNQVLAQALKVIEQAPLSNRLKGKLQQVTAAFPKLQHQPIVFNRLIYNQQNVHYHNAVNIARLLLQHLGSGMKVGKQSLITVLFDMNLLFEAYIYQQLRTTGATVVRQQQVPFWNRRSIRPDIILNWQGKQMVIDTKWKVLNRVHPSMSDVQQAYIYSQYFDAKECVLLYPKVYDIANLPPTPFQSEHSKEQYTCSVYFAEVIKANRLNRTLGQEMLDHFK